MLLHTSKFSWRAHLFCGQICVSEVKTNIILIYSADNYPGTYTVEPWTTEVWTMWCTLICFFTIDSCHNAVHSVGWLNPWMQNCQIWRANCKFILRFSTAWWVSASNHAPCCSRLKCISKRLLKNMLSQKSQRINMQWYIWNSSLQCLALDSGFLRPGCGYLGHSSCTPLQYSCLENAMDGGAW